MQVCADEVCQRATDRLVQEGNRPRDRHALVVLDELSRDFDSGSVLVTVRLRDSQDKVLALTEQEIDLSRHYPNGKHCDSEEFLIGHVDVRASDRV